MKTKFRTILLVVLLGMVVLELAWRWAYPDMPRWALDLGGMLFVVSLVNTAFLMKCVEDYE